MSDINGFDSGYPDSLFDSDAPSGPDNVGRSPLDDNPWDTGAPIEWHTYHPPEPIGLASQLGNLASTHTINLSGS